MKCSRFCIAALILATASAAYAQSFAVVEKTETQAENLRRIHFLVQNGSSTLNRFAVERVVLSGPIAGLLSVPIILEPSLGANAAIYTIGNAAGGADFAHSIAADLARAGLDVYLYSPRETALTPGQCDAPGSCPEAAGWGFAAFLSDLAFIRDLVAQTHAIKPVIGGYSLGGMVAVAAVNEDPTAYAGLILGDSPVWVTAPTLRANYQPVCGGLQATVAAGQLFNTQLNPLAQTLVQLALADPNGVSPIPLFPPGTTNRQAYIGFFSAVQPGPPASIFPPGFILDVGSVPANSFTFASEPRLNSEVLSFNYYTPNAVLRDSVCNFAGDTTFVANLKQYKGPILSFQLDAGFGTLTNETIALTGAKDVDVDSFAGYGHLDLLSSANHDKLLDQPIVWWTYGDALLGQLH
jgi:pimeloyl-ACP methyl ester carboxylesterase